MFKPSKPRQSPCRLPCFNLLSEILFVQAPRMRSRAFLLWSFNLLSEILFVQACRRGGWWIWERRFQSLERDSVCSSLSTREAALRLGVSFNLLSEILFVQALDVVGYGQLMEAFQSLERDSVCSSWRDGGYSRAIQRFNLLSEILFVQAPRTPTTSHHRPGFQSLERDSVCSSNNLLFVRHPTRTVSIS